MPNDRSPSPNRVAGANARRGSLTPADEIAALRATLDAAPSPRDAADTADRLARLAVSRPIRPAAMSDLLTALLPHYQSLSTPARRDLDAHLTAHAAKLVRRRVPAAAHLAHLLPPGHPHRPAAMRRLCSALADTDHTQPAHAAARSALEPLADQLRHQHPAARDEATDRAADRACVAGAETFDRHRDEAPLRALLALASASASRLRFPATAGLLGQANDPAHPATLALRRLVRNQHRSAFGADALAWLAHPALAPPTLARLAKAPAPPVVFDRWHLLLAPSRARLLARSATPIAAPRLTDAHPMPDEDRRFAAVVAAARSLPRRISRENPAFATLRETVTDPSPRVRHAGARALAGLTPSPASDRALADFAFDADPRVAFTAAAPLCRAKSPRRLGALRHTIEALVHSPHAAIRRIAEPAANAVNALRCLDDASRSARPAVFDAPPPALLAWAQRDRAGLAARLSERLAPDDPAARNALALAERLRLFPQLTAPIGVLAGSAHPRLAASAALALRHAPPDAHADAALNALLEHPSPRVRANALEAIIHRSGAQPASVHRTSVSDTAVFIDDETPRVRANALLATLERRPASPIGTLTLDAMLNDARIAHRRSALWVAERLHRPDLLAAVRRRADAEPDADLRRRAARCVRLIELLPPSRRVAA